MKTLKILTILAFALCLLSCGNGLEGTYKGSNGAFFDQLTFISKNKVELVFKGATSEVEYTVEGDKVKITNAGQTQILTITDDGCLDGGDFVGKYCK
ncbi:MAG: hypothetical protein CMO82_02480 [Winogradskyella sp.]|nr:hypothetical protein [Winogradskyella sp.]|tara:strand:+ start:1077 stop:1367 length:291 start_codon:yes stop_codon:yes gene_type:complete